MQPTVICFSGKRKSGKDHICFELKKLFKAEGAKVEIRSISHPLKEQYARMHNLNFKELISDGLYKENYRKEMNAWGEGVRNNDPSYFCR